MAVEGRAFPGAFPGLAELVKPGALQRSGGAPFRVDREAGLARVFLQVPSGNRLEVVQGACLSVR